MDVRIVINESKAARQLLSSLFFYRSNVVRSYGVGLAAFIAALVARVWLDEMLLAGFPFLTFFPAVLLAALLGGSRAGALCAVLAILAAWYWFFEKPGMLLGAYGNTVVLGFFIFINAVAISLIEAAVRAMDRLIQQQSQLTEIQINLEDALRGKEVLLYEVNHRVKNSLQLVSSFLVLEASKMGNIDARSAVMVARTKVDNVAMLHELLYSGGTHDHVDLKSALENIVRHSILSAGRDDVTLEFSFSGDLMMNIRHASPLVLAVAEIITNSLKYGLCLEQPTLTVTANSVSGETTLVIRDNGPGISAATIDKNSGMGLEIVKGLVSQMRGIHVIESDGSGTANVLTIPLDPQSSERESAD